MHLERVRWSPQWGGSRDCEARWQWRRAPLSKLIKNVTRATAAAEIEIFEGNMAELRVNEFDELSSSEEEDDDDE